MGCGGKGGQKKYETHESMEKQAEFWGLFLKFRALAYSYTIQYNHKSAPQRLSYQGKQMNCKHYIITRFL